MTIARRWSYGCLVAGLVQVVGVGAPAELRQGDSLAWAASLGQPVLQQAPWCDAELHARQLMWHGAGDDVVDVELRRGGRALAAGSARADEAGVAQVWLEPMHLSPDEPELVYLRAGDDLVFTPRAGAPVTVTVPVLAADLGPAADRVLGLAPPGATVMVTLDDDATPASHREATVVAGGDGRFEAFATDGIALRAGHHGAATITTGEGHRFTARFAPFQADLTLDSSTVRGRATSGTHVEVAVRRGGGADARRDGTDVVGGVDWSIPGADAARESLLQPIAAGDLVTLSRSSTVASAPPAVAFTVPDLAVVAEDIGDSVTGRGLPDTTLSLVVTPPTGAEVRVDVRTDADGRFRVDLTGTIDIGPGWTVAVTWEVAPGVGVRARDTVTQARVWVHERKVSGFTAPGSVVGVTLYGPDGRLAGRGSTRAGSDGRYVVVLYADLQKLAGDAPIEPGDTVEVEFVKGDPIPLRVPALSARTDPDAERVTGVTIPGAAVTVAVVEPSASYTRTVIAEPSGAYTVDYDGSLDIEPPVAGKVVVTGPGRHVFVTAWAPLQLAASQPRESGGSVSASGPTGRWTEIEVHGPQGDLVFRAAGRRWSPFDEEGRRIAWSADLIDEGGQAVALRTGDEVRVRLGDDEAAMVVPELMGVIDVPENRVVGRTLPSAPVAIQAYSGVTRQGATAATVADGTGRFAYRFGEEFQLTYSSDATIDVQVDGRHHVWSRTLGPSIALDLDHATVIGGVEPGLAVTVSLETPSGVRAHANAVTDVEGRYRVELRDPAGALALPSPGDRLVVSAPGAVSARETSFTVPELTLEPDVARDLVRGRATPGGYLGINAIDQFPWPALDEKHLGGAEPTVRADGTFEGRFGQGVDLRPGWGFFAQYRVPSGHLARRVRYAPLVNVQYGGAHVCGYGVPGDAVHLEAARGGAIVGRADGVVTEGSTYDLVLRDELGRPVATGGGTTVRAQLGTQALEVALPSLALDLEWHDPWLDVSGSGPAFMHWSGLYPQTDCLSYPLRSGSYSPGQVGRSGVADAAGKFTVRAFSAPPPGEALSLAFRTSDGHRTYRPIARLKARVLVDTNRIGGTGTPFDQIEVALRDAAGAELARQQVVADEEGRFEARLLDDAGRPLRILAGQTVVAAAGGDRAMVAVEGLSFDFAASDRLIGIAPPGRDVLVYLVLLDGRALTAVKRRADAQGRFEITPEDLAARSTWRLADVAHIEIVLPTAGGHEIVAEGGVAAERWSAAFLPLVVRGS